MAAVAWECSSVALELVKIVHGLGDGPHLAADVAHGTHEALGSGNLLLGQPGAGFHGGHGLFRRRHVALGHGLDGSDGRTHVPGGGHGLFGQLADLVSHHREPSAGLPGPGRLDGGIQREQVGLIGDVGDDAEHFADGLAVAPQRGHVALEIGCLVAHADYGVGHLA